jgi:hypothetical protein
MVRKRTFKADTKPVPEAWRGYAQQRKLVLTVPLTSPARDCDNRGRAPRPGSTPGANLRVGRPSTANRTGGLPIGSARVDALAEGL